MRKGKCPRTYTAPLFVQSCRVQACITCTQLPFHMVHMTLSLRHTFVVQVSGVLSEPRFHTYFHSRVNATYTTYTHLLCWCLWCWNTTYVHISCAGVYGIGMPLKPLIHISFAGLYGVGIPHMHTPTVHVSGVLEYLWNTTYSRFLCRCLGCCRRTAGLSRRIWRWRLPKRSRPS